MRGIRAAMALMALVSLTQSARAQPLMSLRPSYRPATPCVLQGQLVKFTCDNGQDKRIWSPALQQKRDLCVYLPPGFDLRKQYPLVLFLHGFGQDEENFAQHIAPRIDRAIMCGVLPPCIVAAPDGSISGTASLRGSTSAFINSNAGRFEDYLMVDVWNFLVTHFPIRPEREAHVLAGDSVGGGAAFAQAIKHRDRFGVVAAVFPALNLRWVNCRGRYSANFDPCCWGWRNCLNPDEIIARYYLVVKVRYSALSDPLFGRGPDAIARIAQVNPIEMLDSHRVGPGDLKMYVAYAGRDQFNIDAQVESFLYRARQRGLPVTVDFDPSGRHDLETGLNLFNGVVNWLGPQIAPYAPR